MMLVHRLVIWLSLLSFCFSQSPTKKPLSAYTDADFDRLYDQWEENEDKLPDDELPPHKRAKQGAKVNLNQMNLDNPEALMKTMKRGQSVMVFVKVAGTSSEREADELTQIWQDGLFNAHIEIKRYMIGADKALFLVTDGAMAWEVKEFLVKQPKCLKVTIDGKDFPGAASSKKPNKVEL